MIRKAVVATHVFAFGTSQALYAYLQRRGIEALYIGHKLHGNVVTWLFGAAHTFIKVLVEVLRTRQKFDLYVGSNNLNAFVGLLCRKAGLVGKVVYFSPDYVRERFANRALNRFYHRLDRYCVIHCDLTWNSSAIIHPDPMMVAREHDGFPTDWRVKQIQVPDGTDPKEVYPFHRLRRKKIGFIGHLRPGMGGVELIEMFVEIQRRVPEAELLLIGSGPQENEMRQRAHHIHGLEMTGYMGNIDEVYARLSDCAVAVAPYEQGSISQFTDPGKVKVYLSVGLPIVISRVPVVAEEIGREQCGYCIEPGNREAFIDAVVRLLTDDKLYLQCRQNALRLKERYSWDNIFDRALLWVTDPAQAPKQLQSSHT